MAQRLGLCTSIAISTPSLEGKKSKCLPDPMRAVAMGKGPTNGGTLFPGVTETPPNHGRKTERGANTPTSLCPRPWHTCPCLYRLQKSEGREVRGRGTERLGSWAQNRAGMGRMGSASGGVNGNCPTQRTVIFKVSCYRHSRRRNGGNIAYTVMSLFAKSWSRDKYCCHHHSLFKSLSCGLARIRTGDHPLKSWRLETAGAFL